MVEDLALALGDAHDLVLAAQLAAVEAEGERPEADRFGRLACRRGRGGADALEDVAEPQDQLARLEGLRQVVVGADLEAGHPVGGVGAGGQHQDRHLRGLPDGAGIVEAGLARHHHVEHEGVEHEALGLGPRLRGARGRRHPVAVLAQEAGEEIAQAPVVVDHEDVRRVVGDLDAGASVSFARHGLEDQPLHMGAVVGVDQPTADSGSPPPWPRVPTSARAPA